MAIGTAYSAGTSISSTAGVQSITLNSDAITDIVAACGSGKVTMCLMGFHYDYNGVSPTTSSGYHRIQVYYAEHSTSSYRPKINITHDSGTFNVTAESTGNDDDSNVGKFQFGDTDWDNIRGDETTTGNAFNNSFSFNFTGTYNTKLSSRGTVIVDCRRSYFVFDFSSISAPTSGVSGTFSCRMDYTGQSGGAYHADITKAILVKATTLAGTTADYGNCFVADEVATHNATFFGANF